MITIFGGSGFLGYNLTNILDKKNIDFSIFDINDSHNFPNKVIKGDICKPNDLDKVISSEVFINLAAVHRDDIKPLSLYDDVNVEGSRKICELARKRNVKKIIFASSVAIYGFAKPNTDESGEINYFNDYGRTKYEAEKIYREWYEEKPHERSLVIIRPTVIFGKGNRGNVFNLFNQINKGLFAMIGDGENIKSMAYVKNVASFFEYSINFEKGLHIFNYIDKPDLNMNQLITIIREVLFKKRNVGIRVPKYIGISLGRIFDIFAALIKKNLPISHIRVIKFISTTQFETSINSKTNFKAPFDLTDAIKETLEFEFKKNNIDKITFDTE